MKPTTYLRFLTFVVAAVMLVAATRVGTAAQDATPAAQPIVVTLLGQGMPIDTPGKVLQLQRVTLTPGAVIPTHIHPGAYVIHVEAGDFGFTVVKGEAQITRAGSTETAPIPAGGEVVAHEGDTIFEDAGGVHTARNAGTTPVVVLAAALLAADEPGLQPTNDEGTPTAS